MKKLKLTAALALVLGATGGLAAWWHHNAIYPSTEDAYLRAHKIDIAAQVSGTVDGVFVQPDAHVEKGDMLFRVDPSKYAMAVSQAQAQVSQAQHARASSDSEIKAAEQALRGAKESLTSASKAAERDRTLFENGNTSQARVDQDKAAVAQAQAAVDAAKAKVQQARNTAAARDDALKAAMARLSSARIDLEHTRVSAPHAGWVAKLDLRPGATVTAYQPLFAIVEDGQWWVDANFKETDLARIAPGQPVKVDVDMLPGKELTGKVVSIGRGSGASFSLLPAQNASGNWVKVTQRFTVRVALDPTEAHLRTGASVTAQVDTSREPDAERAQ